MFDALLATILRQELSFDSSSLVNGDGVYFTTFGISDGISHTKLSQEYSLGRLSESDLSDTLNDAIQ